MEKKSLGRGLEDISNIFLSTNEKTKEKKVMFGFSPVVLRDDSCASCTNIIQEPFDQPKCKIFSLESEEHGVRSMGAIALTFARNCEYFRPITPEKTDSSEASEVGYSYRAENQCDVEETVKVRRTIAFQNDETVHQRMAQALFRHLKEGYYLRRVELKKTEDNSEPRNRVHTEEEVTIFIKGSLSP